VKISALVSRPYQSADDLYAIGKLIRRAYASSPSLNAWSFCRFDIWAQRRIAKAESYQDRSWQEHMRLWTNENGTLAGAAFACDQPASRRNPCPYALILEPGNPGLAEEMLDWTETRAAPEIEALAGGELLNEMLLQRGYTCSADCMIRREKRLAGLPEEPVLLPPAYHIERLVRKDWTVYFVAVNAVFNFMDTVDVYRLVQQAPSFVRELHLNVICEGNGIAAFCSAWWDRENGLAELEPVGTVPRFRKLGLASALLAYTANRLREMGCPRLQVDSWSESLEANCLYEGCGLLEKDRVYTWKKER
jgi:GNAT superfamily N-acetyltransferase